MHMLELNNPTWRVIELKGKKDVKSSKSKEKEIDDIEMDAPAAATSQGF